MKNKIVLFIAILISIIIFVSSSYSTLKYRSQSEDDRQLTTLVQKIKYFPEQKYQRLLSKDKITLTFTAKYNNLGTLAFYFNNYQKINSDWVWFRIKEEGSKKWYYENKYNTDQFNPEYYFTFGFPVINNSQNKKYQIEIQSIYGTPKNSISLHSKTNVYIAKYSFSKSFLIQNPKQIIPFVINKFKIYYSYVPISDIYKIIFKSLLPLLVYLLTKTKPSRLFKYIKYIQNNAKINKFLDIFIPIFIFFVTLIISGYFSLFGVDPHHDGILIKPALDVSRGLSLFKETFTQYGALTTYIQALSLNLFGEYLIVIKLLTALTYSLISLLLYLIYKRFLPKIILLITLVIWVFMAPYYTMTFLPWSSVYTLFFQLLTAYLFILYFERNNKNYFMAASVSSCLIFWCRQPVGILTFLAICIYFIFQYYSKQIDNKTFKKLLFRYILINIGISTIFILHFLFSGSFTDWFKQSILFSFFWGENTSDSFSLSKIINSLFPASISALSIWILIPISTTLTFITNHKNKYLSLLSFIGLSSWLQYYPVSCIRHQYWAATPMFPLFSFFIYQYFKKHLPGNHFKEKKLILITLSVLVITLCFLPDILYRLEGGYKKIKTNYQYVSQPTILKHMKIPPEEARHYTYLSQNISKYFEQNPQGNVVTNGPNALYLTFNQKIKNIQPVTVNWASITLPIYPDYWKTFNNYLETNKPLVISFWNQIPSGYCRIDNINNSDSATIVLPCEKIKNNEKK